MTKINNHYILDILRRYEIADDDNKVRDIEKLKIIHPTPSDTLATFKFAQHICGILFDEEVADDRELINEIIQAAMPHFEFNLIKNPTETETAYGIPYKGKSCYLFIEKISKKRLDVLLSEQHPEISRSTWQKYIKAGYVKIADQTTTSPKLLIHGYEDIKINIPANDNYDQKSLPIIYRDKHVLVISKPAGVLAHSKGALNDEFTVADFFRRYTSYNLDTNRPGIVHRLDRDTSGVMIGALDDETAKLLQKQFSSRKTKKTYYAIVKGIPKHEKANLDLPIERNPSAPSMFRVGPNGKKALTIYEVIASHDNISLVKLQPLTGRTHQLRVHMAYIGHPIIGDRIYGETTDRLYLHAYSLEITIPNGKRTTFIAPLPDEFTKFFKEIAL